MENNQERAMKLATEAGHILLENGAEISRVEDTMRRIATAYGVDEKSFFVLSNGIIATAKEYAWAEFIPIKGTQLSRVADVNQLSRDVVNGCCTLDELEKRLYGIRHSKVKPAWERIFGVTLGVSAFCINFGGSFMDAFVTLVVGLFLGTYMAYFGKNMSRIFNSLTCGIVGGLLCVGAYHIATALIDTPVHLANMIIGTIIALVPGVPFTNGMRDLANEDYIAGSTRLIDALITFLCIAIGVVLALQLDNLIFGDLLKQEWPVVDGVTSAWYIQLAAAFVGTASFSIIFGTPRKYYLECGFVGMVGWAVYIFTDSVFLAAMSVALIAHAFAGYRHCPVTVFMICGIIPLVPGGGIFWTSYFIVTNQLLLAADTGFNAVKAAIAIAGGIIVMTAIFYRILKKYKLV